MNLIRENAFCGLVLIAMTLGLGHASGQSCSTPLCSPNPVPCAHCIGTWLDNTGARWTVTSLGNPLGPGTQAVSGSVTVPFPAGCPSVTWTVSGTLTQTTGNAYTAGTTALNWQASNPNPSRSCGGVTPVSTMTYTGNIDNNGCDTGAGSSVNSSGVHGSFSMTKPTDVASSETSAAVAWYSVYPTILLFQGNISPASLNSLAGRQVFESPNGTPTDSCYRTTDPSNIYPFHLSGGGWYVGYYYFNSSYYYDYVGFTPGLISYYRSKGRTPCLATAPQAMNIYTRAGVGS
jgi:hypothetical protein